MPKTEPRQRPFDDETKEGAKNGNGYIRPMFVRCELTADQRKELATWANSRKADDLLDYIMESISEGYTLSLKEAEQGYQASLTQVKKAAIGVPNVGKCLVTRASKPERALWAIYYKHTQVMEKDWSRGNEEAELEW